MESGFKALEILLNFFEAYILYRMSNIFLLKKYRNHRYVYILSLVVLWCSLSLKSIVEWFVNDSTLSLFMFVLCLICILSESIFLFRSKIVYRLLVALIYISALAAVNLLVMGLLIMFSSQTNLAMFSTPSLYRIESEVLGKTILIFAIEFIARKKQKILSIERSFTKTAMVMLAIDFLLFFLVYIIYDNTEYLTVETAFLFVIISVMILNVFFVYSIKRLVDGSNEVMTEKLKLQNMQLKLQLSEDMNAVTKKLRELRHDMNNHVSIIYGFVDLKQYENLKLYVEELYNNIKIANDFIIVKNEVLSIILNTKVALAREKGIEVESSIIMQDIDLPDLEICSLFGNILDNAIEACEQTAVKYIALSIKEDKNGWRIECRNSFESEPIFDSSGLVSLKADKEMHGIGTKNVYDIVKKHDGNLEYDIQNGIFSVEIFIPKNIRKV